MNRRIIYTFFFIINLITNIYSYQFCIAPKSFLKNKMSNYVNLETLSNKVNITEFRNEFKRILMSANHSEIFFWLENIEIESQYKFEIEILKKAINNLINFIDNSKNNKAFSDFSIQVLTYKSLLILLSGNDTSVNITLELLKNIIEYTETPYNRKYEGNIRGLAGVISGIFEVTIKKGTLLIDIPIIKKVNILISENDNIDSHEWDALSNNSVFEFKFTASLNKLYSQILGIGRTYYYLRSISEGKNKFINKDSIVNLIYFGENSSKELTRSVLEYNEKNKSIFNHSQEKGISIRFSIDEFIDFLKDDNTLDLLKKESNEFKYLTKETIETHVDTKIKKYIYALKERAVKHGKRFDIIIGISNPFRNDNNNISSFFVSNINGKKSA